MIYLKDFYFYFYFFCSVIKKKFPKVHLFALETDQLSLENGILLVLNIILKPKEARIKKKGMKKRRIKLFNENAKVRRLNRECSVVSRVQNMFKELTFHTIFQHTLQYMFTDNGS